MIHVALAGAYPTEAKARAGIADDLHVIALGQFRGARYLGVWHAPTYERPEVHVFSVDTDADDLLRAGWTRA